MEKVVLDGFNTDNSNSHSSTLIFHTPPTSGGLFVLKQKWKSRKSFFKGESTKEQRFINTLKVLETSTVWYSKLDSEFI
jgi:hypothetical protein